MTKSMSHLVQDVEKFRRWNWNVNACKMGNENLDNLHKIIPYSYENTKYSKPITFSKYIHKKLKHRDFKPGSNFDLIKQSQPKGIIFIWPQRKNFYYEREYAIIARILAQILYWLDATGLFPSGKGMPVKRPPWKIHPIIPKPENRDYIIEPDWNSIYIEN